MQIIADLWWLWLLGSVVAILAAILGQGVVVFASRKSIAILGIVTVCLGYLASAILPVMLLISIILNIILFVKA
jgi:hypothetical protein